MGRKKKNYANINLASIRKAANGLDLLRKAAQTTTRAITQTIYPVTECLQFLKNMYTQPTYTDLTITNYAWTKLMAYIHLVGDYEISGFGRIQNNKITDFEIIKQEVKSAYVESDADAVLEFIMSIPADQRTEWTLDWHSHVNMGTSPSTTDWTNYSEMLVARQNKQFPAMIVNKAGNVTAYQIICDNRHTQITVHLDTTPLAEQDIEKLYAECKQNVEQKCRKATTYTTYNTERTSNTISYPAYRDPYWYADNDEDWYDKWDQQYERNKKKSESTTEEENEIKPRIKDTDLSYAQQLKMEADGYVFDEETGEAYGEDECCSECGKPLKTETEMDYGVCFNCFQKAMNEEAIAYHKQSSLEGI